MTMALAYWCVLVAAMLPYVWTTVAKASGERYDNRDPRGWLARQTNPRVHRANSAQLNAFEAFAPFAAGVLMAQFAGVPETHVAGLAVAFVVFRLLHGVVYTLGMKHSLRSLCWFSALACVVALMVLAALRVVGGAHGAV
ncbi:MAPEG family protein [Lysobacter sp. A6]|uniref:MAPEG family protein n=1 Tax=Noviluteimonas lactosilytica TaxID=2888523 RepID=A0ABS8JKQ5_9GAMM|nr:MAPEG family protein [Lysobacter lactosilyticus]MCC8364188.1 MAPEG family protein [Lysobacter lactosilyticus]